VARLLTRPELLEQVRAEVPDATKVTFNLHPPMLRSMGMDKKLKLGKGFRPAFVALAKAKALRGTPLDPFGRAHVRRVERQLAASHTALVERLTSTLSADSYDVAVQAAAASELVRGYEEIKLGNVERYRARLVELGL
jgi:indolepyruvate ferredoxin oxidoreductase